MEKFTEHFKSWLSGFIDGEGCFALHTQTVGRGFAVQFVLRVRADELSIVKKIHQYLGGSYYVQSNSGSPNLLVNYTLCGAKNCLRLVKHLEKYPLLAKKKQDFEIWREAIYLLLGKEHLKGRRDYLLYLCDKIKKVRQYEKVEMPQVPIDKQLILLGDN
jgi:hypothetical protein